MTVRFHFIYTKYFPKNVINSITLKDAIVSISEDLGVPILEKSASSGQFYSLFNIQISLYDCMM